MDDDKTEPLAGAEELPVEDLDVDDAEAEVVKGGGGGDFESGTWGNIKRAV